MSVPLSPTVTGHQADIRLTASPVAHGRKAGVYHVQVLYCKLHVIVHSSVWPVGRYRRAIAIASRQLSHACSWPGLAYATFSGVKQPRGAAGRNF